MKQVQVATCVAALLWAGCASDDGSGELPPNTVDLRVEVPEAPDIADGIQFIQPDTIIAGGTEAMTCWVPDWVPERDYYIRSFEGVQGEGGHHAVALGTEIPYSPGDVFDCTNIESLAGFRPLILPDPADGPLLPDGFYVRLPAGALIVIQSHYINYRARDVVVADVARFQFTEPEGKTEAGYLVMNHGGIELPPRAPTTVDLGCTPEIPRDINMLVLFGHMHEMGTDITVSRLGEGDSENVIYEIPVWQADYRDLPPVTRYAQDDEAALIRPGEQLHLNCGFDNPLDEAVTFPREMCTAVAYYYPALPGEDRLIVCEE